MKAMLKSLLRKPSTAESTLAEIQNINDKIDRCGQKRAEYLAKLAELQDQKLAAISESLEADQADNAFASDQGLRQEIQELNSNLRDIEAVAASLLDQKRALVERYCDEEFKENTEASREMSRKHTALFEEIKRRKAEFEAWLEPKELECNGLYAQYRRMSYRDKHTLEELAEKNAAFALELPWSKPKKKQLRSVILTREVDFGLDGRRQGKGIILTTDDYPAEQLQSLAASGNADVYETEEV